MGGVACSQSGVAQYTHLMGGVACSQIVMALPHRYAVFGLGSRAYPNFCTFGHTCDNLLKDLGAEQIIPCGEGDEMCGQEESFQSWLQECYVVSGREEGREEENVQNLHTNVLSCALEHC